MLVEADTVETTMDTAFLAEKACTANLGMEVITLVTRSVCGHIGCCKTTKPTGRHYGYADLSSAVVGLGVSIPGELDSVGAFRETM